MGETISLQVRPTASPSTSPKLEHGTQAKPLPKTTPTATKAAPPKAEVEQVARPLLAPVAPPTQVGGCKGAPAGPPRPSGEALAAFPKGVGAYASPAPPLPSQTVVPTKRAARPMENTAAKIARLVGPALPKAESKASPLARPLDKELDVVSDSKGSPCPETSLVFDQHQQG